MILRNEVTLVVNDELVVVVVDTAGKAKAARKITKKLFISV